MSRQLPESWQFLFWPAAIHHWFSRQLSIWSITLQIMRNFSLWTFIFASLLGCSSTLLKGSRSVATVENPQCSSSCPSGQVCMNIFSSFGVAPKSECTTIPIEAPIADFVLPFDSNTEVVCTHSSGSGSHSDPNAFYAIDWGDPIINTTYIESIYIAIAFSVGCKVFGAGGL
jgi:hypothetical protein